MASIPAIAALFGALFQLSRDSIAYDRTLRLEEAKNRFTVGATSHMAIVAFDKRVHFCEEYAAGVDRAVETLFRRGPHQDVLQNADVFLDLRRKSTVWLTPEIQTALISFEGALRKIGANAWLLNELRADEDRTEAVKEAFGTFAAVMGWETWKGAPVTRGLAAERIVDSLRDTLGIKELTHLRNKLVQRAFDDLKAN
ncbi:MAG: hypothetical protein ACRD37_10580 [Candidatus Acidiferrales bacterium]